MRAFLLASLLAASPAAPADSWFAHVRYLASDRLEGRATGTRAYRLAADYVARQLEAVGLDTELQQVTTPRAAGDFVRFMADLALRVANR